MEDHDAFAPPGEEPEGPPGDHPPAENGNSPPGELEQPALQQEDAAADSNEGNQLGIDLDKEEVWVETKSGDKSYYYNAKTRETTWTRPEEGPGIKILTQDQVEKLAQELKEDEPQEQPQFGMPPPGYVPGPGYMPQGGHPPFMPPPGFPPPWGMPPGGPPPGFPPPWMGMPPPMIEPCDWTEHTSPDGKKYYYNVKTGDSVWDKPKEYYEWERRKNLSQSITPNNTGPPESVAAAVAAAAAAAKAAREKEKEEKPKEEVEVKEKPNKGQDKSRPVSSTPVPGTPWCVVWTGDNKSFFYNPTTKKSVWDRPPDLIGRADVREMLKSPQDAERVKQRAQMGKKEESSDSEGEKDSKIIFEDEMNKKKTEGAILEKGQSIDLGKEAAMEAEVKAARERQQVPLEQRMKQFRELLQEKEISAYATWEKELHKIVFDPRYLLLTSRERKQVFDKYVRERAEEEKREKRNKLKEKRDNFRSLLEESVNSTRMGFSEFASKFAKDDRFLGIDKMRERESMFNSFMFDLKRKEKEEKLAKRESAKKDFLAMLKEKSEIDRHSHWSDVKKSLESDARYKAVDSGSLREDWFLDYVHDLKEEHRRDKRKRSRSRDRDRKKRKSRSRSRSKDRKKKKKRSRSRSRSKDREEKRKRKEEKEEGEMFTEEEDDREEGEIVTKKKRKRSTSVEKVAPATTEENDKDREKRERIAASIKKREEEVARELSSHLHARDKERQQHHHLEAVSHFDALLNDLIRHPDYSWKEAKKVLKKDSRYEAIANSLEKSERERQFDDHVDRLVAKKKENYRKLLEECKSIQLDSSFKEIRKQIKDDPRFVKFSSSDRKCEKAFNEFIKDRVSKAKGAFKELLHETKKITDKTLSVVTEDPSHMTEIVALLSKDKRYLDLDCMEDERSSLLTSYLEDIEKRGPPPPPTASEPQRRTAAK